MQLVRDSMDPEATAEDREWSLKQIIEGDSSAPKKKKIKPGSFQGLGLSAATCKAVMKMGYKMPTPIQRKTIPTVLEGQDMVAMARTGSGKTAAFLIPICERLEVHSVAVGVRAVVLSPTRELAIQTAKFFRQLSKFKGLRCCLLVGGQAMETQFEHLASNPDVVIATPGRLMHHMLEAELSLARIEMLVFDEADRLFELGFAEQLQKILEGCPASRQVLLFSATLPAQLVAFTRSGIKNPAMVRLDVESTLSEQLDMWFLYTRKDEKLAVTISLLRRLHQSGKSTIVFVATKHHVEFFGELLVQLGMTSAVVYGSMDQEAREEQVHRFRKKKASILVTTDVAARGIDIPLLDHVVNYDFPPSAKLFVHRCGRTARAGRSGLACNMMTLEDLPYCVELMLFLGRKLTVANGRPAAEPFKPGDAPIIGSIPSVELEVETLTRLLAEKGSHLVNLYRSMTLSYHLYNKTRPSASKQSMTRSKELLEECGGPARLQGLMHPAFCEEDGMKDSQSIERAVHAQDFIQQLRGFRPRIEKVGNVISPDSMKFMGLSKRDADIGYEVRKAALGQQDKSIDDIICSTSTKKGRERKKRKLEEEETVTARLAAQTQDKPRMSKRARNKGGPTDSKAMEDFDGFDVQVDGMDFNSATDIPSGKEKKAPVQQFYLSTERKADDEAKERGLDMEAYQLDLAPDEGSALMKHRSVIKWDAKKKKYLPVMVAADGRVVKKSSRTGESGERINESGEKSGSYQKWAKANKKRIQGVGELENANQGVPLGKWAKAQEAKARARTVDFGGDDDGDGEGGSGKSSGTQDVAGDGKVRKPIVPYHGDISAEHLTHKQKRMLDKRASKDSSVQGVTHGEAKSELKTGVEIQHEKFKLNQNKAKQNPHMRKQLATAAKDKRRSMHEDRQMKYGAHTKSRMMIFEGEKKGYLPSKKERERHKKHQRPRWGTL